MTPRSIMIFSAGYGKRMAPLTNTMPKPMIRVSGKPLIRHALDLTNGFEKLNKVVNLHYKGQMIKDHLIHDSVLFSLEDELLDTGGGLRKALPLLGHGPVFTLNTDAVWIGGNPLLSLAEAWDPSQMDGLLLLTSPANAVGHQGKGDFLIDSQNRLLRGPGNIYSGAQIIKTALLENIPENVFSLNLLWDMMIERGSLFGLVEDICWCDVGRPSNIALAEYMLRGKNVSR